MILFPKVTVVMVTHNKPSWKNALDSIPQHENVEVIIADSGGLAPYIQAYVQGRPTVTLVTTGESNNFRDNYCPISKVTNEVFKAGLVRGEYFCCFYDDDEYLPGFFKKMTNFLDVTYYNWVRCSQKREALQPDGTIIETPPLIADADITTKAFDCRVDGGQVMFRTELMHKLEYPYWPEDPDWNSCSHSDGIFFDKAFDVYGPMGHIEEVLMVNRKTPHSTYSPTGGQE
jgi:glycosyltransferase involved in cell wall biosynthesis